MSDTNPLSPIWQEFYQHIKDSSWPDVATQEDLLRLSPNILKEVIFKHIVLYHQHSDVSEIISRPDAQDSLIANHEYFGDKDPDIGLDLYFQADRVKVCYTKALDGGGTTFGQKFNKILPLIYPGQKFQNCFEWCAGPGFIGFGLLSRGLCDQLYFNDIYEPAIKSIKTTIESNKEICENRVFYQHARSIRNLPTDWKFDLVVSNPPHWNPDLGQFITKLRFRDRICCDAGWKIRKDFFSNISKHLNPNAVILFQEHTYASGPSMFESLIEKHGLYISDIYHDVADKDHYYLEIKQK